MNRTIRPAACRCILIAGLLTCMASSATAQGRISGIVKDEDGNGIQGATVAAENLVRRSARRGARSTTTATATTNGSGRFAFISLDRGQWRFVIRAVGFEPVQGVAPVRRSGPGIVVQFTMKADKFNPRPPAAGILAGLTTRELVESLEAAEGLFDRGAYDAAIDAYRSILDRVPALTSLSLQIGHAFREKQEPDQALAAYLTLLDTDPSNVEALAAIDAISQTAR